MTPSPTNTALMHATRIAITGFLLSMITACASNAPQVSTVTPNPAPITSRYLIEPSYTNPNIIVAQTNNWLPGESKNPTQLRVIHPHAQAGSPPPRYLEPRLETDLPLSKGKSACGIDHAQTIGEKIVPNVACERAEQTFEIAVYFDTAKAELTEDSLKTLKQIPIGDFKVVGHADIRGDAESNLKLSLRRAKTVAQWLKAHGHNVDVVSAAGAISASADPARYETDRRVTIEKSGKPVPASVERSDTSALAKVVIYFSTASSELSDEATAKLQTLPNGTFRLTGYTDRRGSAASNLALSNQRVNSVKNWLIANDRSVTRAVALGDKKASEIPADYSKDRKVVVELIENP